MMNSAAELKRHNERDALQKARDKVVSALNNDPMGLSIAQLMSVCKLSIKTVKNILSTLETSEEDGVFFLANAPRATTETFEQVQAAPKAIPKEIIAQESSRPAAKVKRDLQAELMQLFEKNPKGLLGTAIISNLNITDKQFSQMMWMFRKSNSVARTGNLGEFHYQLVTEVEPLDVQESEKPKVTAEIDQAKWQNFCDVVPEVANDDHQELEPVQPPSPLEDCKSLIKTVVTRKSELTLKPDQLSMLLADLFGLNNVAFCVDAGRLVGVVLSEEQVA